MEDIDRMNEAWNEIRNLADAIGDRLEKFYPRDEHEDGPSEGHPSIRVEHRDELTQHLLMVIAEIIQAWIDAGSEREVTMENEELYNAIHKELEGW